MFRQRYYSEFLHQSDSSKETNFLLKGLPSLFRTGVQDESGLIGTPITKHIRRIFEAPRTAIKTIAIIIPTAGIRRTARILWLFRFNISLIVASPDIISWFQLLIIKIASSGKNGCILTQYTSTIAPQTESVDLLSTFKYVHRKGTCIPRLKSTPLCSRSWKTGKNPI